MMETMRICQAIYDFKCAFIFSEANRMGIIDDDAYCKVLTSVLQQMDKVNAITRTWGDTDGSGT